MSGSKVFLAAGLFYEMALSGFVVTDEKKRSHFDRGTG
jgi:hypothetical protein